MRELELDPIPADMLESLHATAPHVAERIEECLDWIEVDPPDIRARRRCFTNGMWAIVGSVDGSDWVIFWDEDEPGRPVVRHIGETASL